MIKIEKLKTKTSQDQILGRPPGYVDIFLSNPNTMFHWYYNKFSKLFLPNLPNDFSIGKEYGIEGKPIELLLSEEPDDTIYEIDFIAIKQLPTRYIKHLLKNHRVLMSELMEWDMFTRDIQGRNMLAELRRDYEIRDLIEHDCGPMYALFTHNALHNQYPNGCEYQYNPQKLALVPARKPRVQRVHFLADLHHAGLLKNCDWSLTYVQEPPDVDSIKNGNGDFFKSPNVNAEKWGWLGDSTDQKIVEFYNTFKNELPKSFDMDNKLFSDTSKVSSDWLGNYTFNISLETQSSNKNKWGSTVINASRHFITEKTYKGFMLGLPTMIHGPSGIENSVKRYGFEFYSKFDYDGLEREERRFKMIDCLQQPLDKEELSYISKTNFDKSWDKNYLINLFVSRFK